MALAACASPEREERVVADLVGEFEWAEALGETEAIDLGTPEGAVRLRQGWSWSESAGDRTYAWGLGGESRVSFFVAAPRDLVLRFRAWPHPFDGGPPQAVTWLVNGADVGTVELPNRWGEHRLPIAAGALREGVNTLELRYRRTAEPGRRRGGTERRRLAVAFDWIRFEGLADAAPRADPELARLTVPFGTRVTYHFEVSGPARLAIAGLRLRGEGRLEIAVRQEGSEERLAAALATPRDGLSIPLDTLPGPVRLRLEARGAAGDRRGGVSLEGPVEVRAAVPPAERAGAGAAAGGEGEPARERPDIVLYTVDTLRADRLEPYGYGRPASPRIAAFAAESVLFERCLAQAPWTLPAMASVLTGLGPRVHGAGERGGTRLPDEHLLLPELLQRAGYRTAAFIANGWVSGTYGFDQGFDLFAFEPGSPNTAEQMHRNALEWLDGQSGEAPLFVWVHTIEPHAPYDPPEEYRRRFASGVAERDLGATEKMKALKKGAAAVRPGLVGELNDLYDAEVAFQDAAFGAFLDALRDRGRYERAVVLLHADHGEEFYEHGSWTHGHSLFDEMIRVPLIVRFPGAVPAGLRIAAAAQQIDLLPTLLELAGVEDPPQLPGRSLIPLVRSGARGLAADPDLAARPIFSFRNGRHASVSRGRYKLLADVHPSGDPLSKRLFDLAADPGESRDLAEREPITAGLLASLLRREVALQRLSIATEPARPDPETLRQLRALGYAD